MKNILWLMICFVCSAFSFSQEVKQDSVYVVADVMPEYKEGGMVGFRKYVANNYRLPDNIQTDLNGTIILSFIVEPDGELSTIEVLRDLGFGTGQEASRVVSTSERWTPGVLNDKPVRVKLTLPIPINVVAQIPPENDTLTLNTDPDRVYINVEVMPEYKDGGIDGFRKFVAKNYRVPNSIPRAINGTIIVHFVVERDGTLSSIKVVRDLGYGTGKEAARVIAKSKKWKPGFLNNKAVKVAYTFPIILNVANPTINTLPESSKNSDDFNRNNFRVPKEFGPK